MNYPVSTAFWSTSATWYQSRLEAQAKNKALGGTFKGMAHKQAQWARSGARYLRGRLDLVERFKVDGGAGAFMVRVDPRLSRDILDFINQINPAIVAAMDRHIGQLAQDAFIAWPTHTGLSKALLGLEYHADGETFTGQVVNTAPYVFMIKGSPHRKLLEGPAPTVAVRIGTDVMASLRVAA